MQNRLVEIEEISWIAQRMFLGLVYIYHSSLNKTVFNTLESVRSVGTNQYFSAALNPTDHSAALPYRVAVLLW